MPDDQAATPNWNEPGEAPLAVFEGAMPPAPKWFDWAVAQEPERSFVEVLGAKIELLAWGERGKPGLILVHGNSAHADWWSFIAPYLAQDYRVAAISLSGMGASDWRDDYSFETFAQEVRGGAEAAGLYDAPVKPIFIGHSFGGSQVFYAARKYPEWMRGAILVDTGFGGPPPAKVSASRRCAPRPTGSIRPWRRPWRASASCRRRAAKTPISPTSSRGGP
jgi:pimeloyl-ACP methyl ester carboxylesterase